VAEIEAVLTRHYAGAERVRVVEGAASRITRLEPEALNDSDDLELFVFGTAAYGHALLVARLDNLGKGAAGAAVQNIKLMLGC
jgi:N-acetyl-gamma-glutamyl-phosphate reductase